jgi:hypothetical protein
MLKILWLAEPEEHDYPAAEQYLSLLMTPTMAANAVKMLREAPTVEYKAKDILRASGLPLLDKSNPHVAADLAKIEKGSHLSPVLMVRGNIEGGLHLQIGDGYHRVCASYWIDENSPIPGRMI